VVASEDEKIVSFDPYSEAIVQELRGLEDIMSSQWLIQEVQAAVKDLNRERRKLQKALKNSHEVRRRVIEVNEEVRKVSAEKPLALVLDEAEKQLLEINEIARQGFPS
jgi:DNA repair ATPase RecN